MRPGIDHERRRFLRTAGITIGAAPASLAAALAEAGIGKISQRASRELTAIGNAAEWINSPRLTPSTLSGKVVLVNFWTYTCINWLRTLPYVRAWAQKYQQGLVVLGVHTPEFPFEHNVENVRRAVQQMRIEYPIVIDNDYSIWRAFDNQVWPALYFLDTRGHVRQHQFGEGEYQTSERAIQRLLKEAGFNGGGDGNVSVDGSGFEAAADWTNLRSPESYVGYARMQNFASPDSAKSDQPRTYRVPSRLALNQWSLAGDWTICRQATLLNKTPGQILYRFHARDVHLVMGRPVQGRQYGSACRLTGNRPVPLTAST
jgi:thiol-disulfide isomerase/thioredoxin